MTEPSTSTAVRCFHIGSLGAPWRCCTQVRPYVLCRRVEAPVLCELIDPKVAHTRSCNPRRCAQMVEANGDGHFNFRACTAGPADRPAGLKWSPSSTSPRCLAVTGDRGGRRRHVPFLRPAPTGAWPGPLSNVEVHTPDGLPVGPGEVGEIAWAGPMVMNCYHNRDTLTAHRARGGWHHTHDLGGWRLTGRSRSSHRCSESSSRRPRTSTPPRSNPRCARIRPSTTSAVLGVPDDVWGQRVKAVVVVSAPITARS